VTSLDLGRRLPVSLADVVAEAPATVRVDRKYLVDVDVAQEFVDRLPEEFRVLEIDGRRTTTYASTYFDTPDFSACRAHLQQRRRRWKFRSRLYVEDGFCRLEVKARAGNGVTSKYFHDIEPETHGLPDDRAHEFLRRQLHELGFHHVPRLQATLEAGYRRSTLAAPGHAMRVTLDEAVTCSRHGHRVELDPGYAIVETKGGVLPGAADRLLRDLGQRPRSFSKYAAALSLIEPSLADNDVRRLVGRHLHVKRDS
jgi:hypothetical protein